MKVLILHQHFNTPASGGAIRSYYLAKALVEKGIQVVVFSGSNNKVYKRKDVEGIEVHYLPVFYENKFGFVARSASFIKYVWAVVNKVSSIENINVCYAISTPLTVGLAAIWIKKRYKIPFIFEVGDLWPEAPIQLGFIKSPILKHILYQLERSIYHNSNAVVALSPAIQNSIEQKLNGKRVYLIPNMADIDFYKPEIKSLSLEQKYHVEGRFVVAYIGAFGMANGLSYFLECARASQKSALPIQFLLCGDGAMHENLKQSAASLALRNLSFIPFQNRDGVREVMNVADAVFICYKHLPVLETGSPNKYFDGLASGKLIIINFGGWIKEEIEGHTCGIQIDPKQPTDFVKKILPFLSKDYANEFGQYARALATAKYSREILNEKFILAISDIMGIKEE